ncbi:hypothetical protein Dimus_037065, partial [Dionaea muscipula]
SVACPRSTDGELTAGRLSTALGKQPSAAPHRRARSAPAPAITLGHHHPRSSSPSAPRSVFNAQPSLLSGARSAAPSVNNARLRAR